MLKLYKYFFFRFALDNAARTYIGNMSAHATDVNNQNEHDREHRYANAVGRYHDNLA